MLLLHVFEDWHESHAYFVAAVISITRIFLLIFMYMIIEANCLSWEFHGIPKDKDIFNFSEYYWEPKTCINKLKKKRKHRCN